MSGDPIKEFGLVIREIRKRQGLSHETLCDAANLDRTFLSQVETGRKQPSLLTVFRIAAALKQDVSEILGQVERRLRAANLPSHQGTDTGVSGKNGQCTKIG
jgi:transcriptional regulator with XRE-family HTH domain